MTIRSPQGGATFAQRREREREERETAGKLLVNELVTHDYSELNMAIRKLSDPNYMCSEAARNYMRSMWQTVIAWLCDER